MDEATHKIWWPLHLRVAKGQKLSAEEQAVYEAGRQQLYAEEKLEGSVEALRKSRERMLELKAEYNRMKARYEEMEAEIARLETQLSEPERQLLGVGD